MPVRVPHLCMRPSSSPRSTSSRGRCEKGPRELPLRQPHGLQSYDGRVYYDPMASILSPSRSIAQMSSTRALSKERRRLPIGAATVPAFAGRRTICTMELAAIKHRHTATRRTRILRQMVRFQKGILRRRTGNIEDSFPPSERFYRELAAARRPLTASLWVSTELEEITAERGYSDVGKCEEEMAPRKAKNPRASPNGSAG